MGGGGSIFGEWFECVKNILIFYCDINIKKTTYLTFMVINSGGIM